MKIISWNIRHRSDIWHSVAGLSADVALLQEACEPPPALVAQVDVDLEPWRTDGPATRRWRTSVVGLRPGLAIERIPTRSLPDAGAEELPVSRVGTLSAARVVNPSTSESLTLVSMYSVWESPHKATGGSWIFADASAHRLISDISGLVGRKRGHRIIAAGDLNALYGHGEHGSSYWAARYRTIFDRFSAIGLTFVGPQSPAGRQAFPWPNELPADSLNVPTYYTTKQTPATATRQLDFVFASSEISPRIDVRALNQVDEWGPSDHCRIEINVRDA